MSAAVLAGSIPTGAARSNWFLDARLLGGRALELTTEPVTKRIKVSLGGGHPSGCVW